MQRQLVSPSRFARTSRPSSCALETLERRALMSATISGAVMQDLSGNGLSADDKPLSGVVVKLYQDLNANGKLDSSDGASIASKTSAAGTGAFSFTGLDTGNYLLKEIPGANQVRTAPVLSDVLAVNANKKNGTCDNNLFANYIKDFNKSIISGITYTISGASGTKTVTSLAGNVHENDTVTVNFTVASGKTATLSLVSYHNPLNQNNNAALLQQDIFNFDTQTFGAGKHQLSVMVPDCFFQIDFVGGQVIDHFGPVGSNIMYTPQGRLIASGLGGVHPCEELPEHEMGRMTGGGSIFLPDGAVGAPVGTRVTHGFELHCAQHDKDGGPITDVNNHLEINWNQSEFHLENLTFVECFDTAIVQAPPKSAPIDTLHGVGNGRFSGTLNGVTYKKADARIEFTLTDGGPSRGEPGVDDTSNYRIVVLDGNQDGVANDSIVVLNTNRPVKLTFGNHQAHKEITPLTRNIDLVM